MELKVSVRYLFSGGHNVINQITDRQNKARDAIESIPVCTEAHHVSWIHVCCTFQNNRNINIYR